MPPTSYNRIPVVFGSVLINHAGRLAEQRVLSSLGWTPGTPIDIRPAVPGVLLVVGTADGSSAIARNGQLPIPAVIRRREKLRIGHRVLLAAHPQQNRLIIVCQTALDALITEIAAVIDGGEQP
ncbi:AbrB/MazE/SpoVT family DNA-binding domain-containing protein [Nocardia terpenica]|uniref:AbrB/MazE/SpoVT family DNA-binding domain-containing protein n=2 Tax=Nocardia terpenica TaxID=455432 RepID=UPI0018945F00|nr:AbrB/MazE/SpoVT family DNA-binding domain-containing protein [Nocardia terpenica]MBF6122101.1 AbrB/MazE/SpoVT family DNA-binding domain-containing protein [Nocardia terpenica]